MYFRMTHPRIIIWLNNHSIKSSTDYNLVESSFNKIICGNLAFDPPPCFSFLAPLHMVPLFALPKIWRIACIGCIFKLSRPKSEVAVGELCWLVLSDIWRGFHHAMVAMHMLPQFACIKWFKIALAAFPNMLDAVVKLVQAFVTEEPVGSFYIHASCSFVIISSFIHSPN